jgi:4-diphosphocytidyl-2-C-methyl-D-erythritol kinase
MIIRHQNPGFMLCFPNAKINLGLNIVNKRSDGYHNIETVFCPVSLCDVLDLAPEPGVPGGTINLTITGIPVDGPTASNLCAKAYYLLSGDFKLPSITAHLHKIIPPGAGLGGGSSDAAFMLINLNLLFDLGLTGEQLCDYASRLGSDCAFFIRNYPLFGFERGNIFRELKAFPPELEVVIINPGIHISTVSAYTGVNPRQPQRSLEELVLLPVLEWKNLVFNDFEESIISKYPPVGEIKTALYSLGAVYASMSGSGSSVYGLFHGKAPAIKEQFPGYFAWSGPVLYPR